MFKFTIKAGMLVAAMAVATSCTNDLDRVPKYEVTSASVYADFANYKPVLARLYATLAVSGQQGIDNVLPENTHFQLSIPR